MSIQAPRSALALLFVTLLVTAVATAQRSASTIPDTSIFEAIRAREGLTICEIGAGDGDLTLAAARIVGPSGRVYTSELGADRVKTLQENVTKSGLPQITVVTGEPTATNFPSEGCDAIFLRNVYHHFADPGPMNRSIAASLKRGGRLAVIDFAPRGGTEAARAADRGDNSTHGVSAASLSRELREAGFEPVSTENADERWFMVVVAKPAR